jgi:hypothetical protein
MKHNQRNFLLLILLLTTMCLGYIIIVPSSPSLRITEVSCSGEEIWIKYDLKDDDLSAVVPDCASNPAGGWVGEINAYAITPQGNEYLLGGYTASADSTQKISCGGTYQTGKRFFGNYIPNEGLSSQSGSYKVKIIGKYRLASENYAIAHTFIMEDTASINCVIPSSTCEDGTPLNTCSEIQIGKYCTASAYLTDKASTCGCPDGYEASGKYCDLIDEEEIEIIIPPDYDPETGEEITEEIITTEETSTEETTSGDYLYLGTEAKYWLVGLGAIILLIGGILAYRRK